MTKPVIIKRNTKGSHLTFTELDQNFQNLDDATISIAVQGDGTVVNDLNGTTTLVPSDEISLTADNTAKTITVSEKIIRLYAYVHNAQGATISKGQPVYLYQATGDKPSVKLANNTGDATSAKVLGLAAETLTTGADGYVITQGKLVGVNTAAFSEGDTLYLGATDGSLTATKPYAPNHLVYIGVVAKANAGAGEIYVRPQNGYELEELHNVNINHNVALSNGQTLVYNSSNSLWENKTVATDLVNDTTPQLGGDLDVNGHLISSDSGQPVIIHPGQVSGAVDPPPLGSNILLKGIKIVMGTNDNNTVLTTSGNQQLIIGINSNSNDNTIEINPSGVIETTLKSAGAFAISEPTNNAVGALWDASNSVIHGTVTGSSRRVETYQTPSYWQALAANEPYTTTYGKIKLLNRVGGANSAITLEADDVSMASIATGYSKSIDRSGSDTSYANSATVDFPNFSGMIIVNNTGTTGQIMTCICGGGSVAVLGYSGTSTPHKTGTITAVAGINGYRWTNDSGATDTFTFTTIKTRNTG